MGESAGDPSGESTGGGRASPTPPILPEPPPPSSTADGVGLCAIGKGLSSLPLTRGADPPPPSPRRLAPDPIQDEWRPVSEAAPDLPLSSSSSPDPSTADRDWEFLNHTK